jgi:hypothetical protein
MLIARQCVPSHRRDWRRGLRRGHLGCSPTVWHKSGYQEDCPLRPRNVCPPHLAGAQAAQVLCRRRRQRKCECSNAVTAHVEIISVLDIIKPVSYESFKEGERQSKWRRVTHPSIPRSRAPRDRPSQSHPYSGPERRSLSILSLPNMSGPQSLTLCRE